jgi:hypothetical protein
MSYDPDRSSVPWSQDELEAARKHRSHRTLVPVAGQHVQYRHDHHRDVTDAVVVDVLWDVNDPNCFTDGMVVSDPWPIVRLRTMHGLLDTREARVRGSAGWLALGWDD